MSRYWAHEWSRGCPRRDVLLKRLLVSGLIALVAGCSFQSLPRLEQQDAGRDGSTDSAVDAGAVDARPDAGCAANETVCGSGCADLTTDNNNCGGCGTTCTGGTTCRLPVTGTISVCCPSNQTNCNGICVDTATDETNCGACAGAGGAVCSGASNTCCGGACVDTTTSEANCGGCAGAGGTVCSAGSNTCCNSACVNTMTDEANCGGCAGAGGTACAGGNDACCSGSCVNTNIDEANCGGCGTSFACSGTNLCCGASCTNSVSQSNCGACGFACSGGDTCQAAVGTGQPDCCAANETNCAGTCVDVSVSNTNCGSCGTTCNTAAGDSCKTGLCCSSNEVNCNGVCRNPLTDELSCGGCGTACTGVEICDSGHCCAAGLSWCPSANACVDLTSDKTNCGTCGRTCGAGLCQSGQCDCEFGTTSACSPGTCKVTSIDPDACGVACTDCTGTDVCVSGGCRTTCPAPLTNCLGEGDDLYTFRRCVNTDADSQNCGTCGNDCQAGFGCAGGTCVPLLIDPPVRPLKCSPAGPAISVPTTTNGGGQTCTGKLAAVSFLFGLCSRVNVGPLSTTFTTDAFDSTFAPYVSSCTLDSQCSGGNKRCRLTKTICTTNTNCTGGISDTCDFPIKCVANTCAGGSVGVNGRNSAGSMVGPLFSNTQATTVGGDFWAFGTVGLSIKGNTTVKQRLFNGPPADLNASNGPFDFTKTTHVYGDANIKGPYTANGSTTVTIDGALTTATACASVPAQVTSGSCTQGAFPAFREPCGTYNNTDGSLLPITSSIVPWVREIANNDNALIGLKYNALENPVGPLHLDLQCGTYYLSSINAVQPIAIAVHGRTVLVVGGVISTTFKLTIDVDPTATLDIFVGGVVDLASASAFGSPAYPRLTRMYVGSDSCSGGGGTCNEVTDCCSGKCTACPIDSEGKPTGPCSGPGICTGGTNKSQAFSMTQGGYFNGLFWAGYGTFSSSNALEVNGAIYANYYDSAGATMIHYDNGAALLGAECAPISTGQACESCRNCNGQACVSNVCSTCSSDTQCCAPLRCIGGSCTL